MTDEQVIKGLECLASEKDLICYGCEYRQFEELTRYKEIAKDALSLIKRQKAEIEKLKGLLWNADSTMYALVYGG